MAVITFAPSDVANTNPLRSERYNKTVASGVLCGETLFEVPADGSFLQTSALASGTAGFRGVALQTQLISGVVSVLRRGNLWGYDIAHMAYDSPVYLSNTVGMLDDAPGALTVQVGRVTSVEEYGRPKVIFIDAELANVTELG